MPMSILSELIPDEAPRLAAVLRGPLNCYFSDTGTTVRLYVTSFTKSPSSSEWDSPWNSQGEPFDSHAGTSGSTGSCC